MVRIIQYRSKCIGCNACVEAAPDRWRISKKDGKCTLVGGRQKKGVYKIVVHDHEYEDNLKSAVNCPVKIIKIERF
jgi:ferredoxin